MDEQSIRLIIIAILCYILGALLFTLFFKKTCPIFFGSVDKKDALFYIFWIFALPVYLELIIYMILYVSGKTIKDILTNKVKYKTLFSLNGQHLS